MMKNVLCNIERKWWVQAKLVTYIHCVFTVVWVNDLYLTLLHNSLTSCYSYLQTEPVDYL